MKNILCAFFLLSFLFSCKRSNQNHYILEDKQGQKIDFFGSAEVGKEKYLVNYDNIGFKDLVEDNELPKVDTLIIRRYSNFTGKPVATTEIKRFIVISKISK